MQTDNTPSASDDILDEIKQSLRSRDVVNVVEERVKVVVFSCGARRYALYGRDVREILAGCEIFPVPSLPEYLPGLINVRGDIESAIDLGYILGGERVKTEKPMIAMVVSGDFHSGVIIETVEDVIDLPRSAIKPPLATLAGAARELAAGEVELGEATATLLDIAKLAARVSL